MPYWDNYGVSKSQYDKGDFTKSTDRNVRNLATGKTGVSAAQLAAQNAAAKKKAEAKKKALEDAKHKTWLTNTKKKKKKKTDWVDKTLQTVDTVDKLYKFGTTLNPLNLYKTNPYILGGSLLKSLYDKNKKSKEKEKVSSLDNTEYDFSEIEEQVAFKPGSIKDRKLKQLHNQKKDGLMWNEQNEKTYQQLLEEDKEQTKYPKTALSADGGPIRKKYSTGSNGILDLDETEEDISLTAFNPNFDEIPQLTDEEQLQIDSEENEDGEKRIDLFSETEESDPLNKLLMAEDGISTLFRAKNGGNATKNIKGQPHMLAYITPGEAKTLENLGGQKTMTKEGILAYPPSDNYGGSWGGSSNEDKGETSSNSGWSNNDWGSDQEDDVAQMESDMGVTTDHSPDWTGSDRGWVEPEDDRPGEKIGIHDNRTARDRSYDFDFMYGHRVKDKKDWNEHNKRNSWIEKKQLGKDLFDAFKFGIGPISLIRFGLAQNKKKKAEKEHLQQMIDDMKAAGDTAFSPHTDTTLQLAEQLMIDLNTPKKGEEHEPDGTQVVPVHEEIQEYEQMAWDPMSYLDKIRAKQAQRASLVEKGIIQNNQTMTLNSGGLANLFRVKNQ